MNQLVYKLKAKIKMGSGRFKTATSNVVVGGQNHYPFSPYISFISLVAFVVIFGGIGVYLLLGSHADNLQANCLGFAGSGTISYSSLDACGYPSPDTAGVPSGTTLTTVSSISCSGTSSNPVVINQEYTTGSVNIGSYCTIENSRLIGGNIVVESNTPEPTADYLTHDEISGAYTGAGPSSAPPTTPACSFTSTSGTSFDLNWEATAAGITLDYDYLHCASEPFEGNGTIKDSYIISDECWGTSECGDSGTTHNEAMYIPGGGSGGTDIDHNTILNPYSQTAGIFGDDHAYGPISNLTINNNLIADGGDNGGIATGDAGDGNTNINITNNRLSYVYDTSMPMNGNTAATSAQGGSWCGNYKDDSPTTYLDINGGTTGAACQVATTSPSNTTLPAISGTAELGQVLTANTGTWTGSPTSYSYQWYDESVPISGATGSSYTVASNDVDHTIDVAVTATNANGSVIAASPSTGVVVNTCNITDSTAAQAVSDVQNTTNSGKTICLRAGTYSIATLNVHQAAMTTLEAYPGDTQPTISNVPTITSNNLRIEGFQLGNGLNDQGSGTIDIVGNYYHDIDPGNALWYASTEDSTNATVSELHNRMINVLINDTSFNDGWGMYGCSVSGEHYIQDYNTFETMNQHPLQAGSCASVTAIGNEYLDDYDEYSDQHVDCAEIWAGSGPTLLQDNRCTDIAADPGNANDFLLSGDSGPFTVVNNLLVNSTKKQCFDDTPNGTYNGSMKNGVIEYNTVYNCGDGGIDMDGGSSTGNTVEYNIASIMSANGNCTQFTVEDYNNFTSGKPGCPGTHDTTLVPNFTSTAPSDPNATYQTTNINPAWGYHPARVGYDAHLPGSGATVSTPPANSTPPTISGTTTEGDQLTTTNGTWTNSPTSYTYQWQDCNSSGTSCSNISSAVNSTYTLTSNDVGHTLVTIVSAINSSGTTAATSSATAVITPPAPTCTAGSSTPVSTPTGLTQTSNTYTTISLSWNASTPSPGCTLSSYYVYRDESGTYTKVATVSSGTTYTDTGLSSSTSYSYSIAANDSGPNISAQSTALAASTTADNEAPTVPTNLSATASSAAQVNLSWSASTDLPNPGGVGLKDYNVYRSTSATTGFNVIGTSTTNSYTDNSVSASTKYYYEVTAVDNNSNESAPSTIANTTTPAPTCSGNPSSPSSFVGGSTSLTSVSFSWSASTAATGCSLAGYHVYEVYPSNPSTPTLITTITSPTTTATITGLTPNTSYSYVVVAYDTSAHSSSTVASNTTPSLTIATLADTTPPSAPANVSATAPSSSQVNLSWSASTDNVAVTGYNIYRCTGGSGSTNSCPSTYSSTSYSLLTTASSSTLTYSDPTTTANTNYVYLVSAFDGAGNQSSKTTASPSPIHTPTAIDTTPPTWPTNPTVTAPLVANQSAQLTWPAASDNVAVVGYHVYLRYGSTDVLDTDGGTSNSGSTASTSFTDSCLEPGVSYTYDIKAYDAAGNLSTAISKTITTPTSIGVYQGDVHCNQVVNYPDLLTEVLDWQKTDQLPTQGDVNGDGTVNYTDLLTTVLNWNKSW